jgi:glycosyltransferase involved in cell wall biosynthesis
MGAPPKISILIANRNYGRFLKECVDSVLNQTRSAHEIILVDDGSTDDSAAIAAGYGERIRFLQQTPSGIYAAQIRGLQEITGDWVLTLDSDDALLPHCLEMIAAKTASGISRVSFRLHLVSTNGDILGEEPSFRTHVPEGDTMEYWRKGWEVAAPPASGNMYPLHILKKAFSSSLFFESPQKYPSDRWLQTVASHEGKSVFVPHICGFYRLHSLSMESHFFQHQADILKRIKGHREQATYLAGKFRERGIEINEREILAYRYYYWWLRNLYWFSESADDLDSNGSRPFLILNLFKCILLGAPTTFLGKVIRTLKLLITCVLPRNDWGYRRALCLNRLGYLRMRMESP